jgi:hypothetical protein
MHTCRKLKRPISGHVTTTASPVRQHVTQYQLPPATISESRLDLRNAPTSGHSDAAQYRSLWGRQEPCKITAQGDFPWGKTKATGKVLLDDQNHYIFGRSARHLPASRPIHSACQEPSVGARFGWNRQLSIGRPEPLGHNALAAERASSCRSQHRRPRNAR